MSQVNRETILFAQIETREALDNIDAILSVPGVDVAFIGPNDLSIALGVPGQLDAPIMRDALAKVIETCRRHNKYPALHINNLDLARYWGEQGMRILSFSSAAGMLTQRGAEVAAAIRGAFTS
jgi:2-keto-3-deoxy-L-rhamnonate aldolase RhmA